MKTQKTIIITGTSSGLGKALFDILHTSGARLICVSRIFPEYQAALASKSIMLLTCDLSKQEEVTALIHKLTEMLVDAGEIIFINNAATILPISPIGELDEAAIAVATQTNFTSPVRITNMLCGLSQKPRLILIHLSTGAARAPIVGWSIYSSTKAACKMFFEVLQEQYKGDDRITIHQFDPGVIDTPMQGQIRKADFPSVTAFKMLQRAQKLSDPATVAKKLIEQYFTI